MAEPYFSRLSQIVSQLGPLSIDDANLEIKHFFSGAALYANGKICASLSPAGFALKLPEDARLNLLAEGKGREFHFFPKGPVKKGYIALPDSTLEDVRILQGLIDLSVSYVDNQLNSSTSTDK